jgi:hypothetical protein
MKRFGKLILKRMDLISQTILSIILIGIFSKWFLKKIKKPVDKDSCVILGNGPSLTSQIEEIKKDRSKNSLMCLNEFPLSSLYDELRPDYFTLLDPHYWFKANGVVDPLIYQVLKAINEKTSWNLTLVLPSEMKEVINDSFITKTPTHWIKINYYNRTPISGFRLFRFMAYKLGLGIPFAHNVLVSSIHLMIEAGYKRVFIYGADHSWHEQIVVTKDNVVRVREDHFKFEKDAQSISSREEMYEPIYKFSFDQNGKREVFKIHELFHAYSKVHEGYWLVNEYAEARGCKVFNLSKKSYIDAFDRIVS